MALILLFLLTVTNTFAGSQLSGGGGAVNSYNPIFANQIFVDGVSGSDITGNGSVTAPYLTITNAQAVDISNYNNLYTIVVERGVFNNNGIPFLLTNNSSFYFYSGTVITNGFFLVFNVTNSSVSVVGGVTIYANSSEAVAFYNTSNVFTTFGTYGNPINYVSGSASGVIGNYAGTGTSQSDTASITINSIFTTSIMGGSGVTVENFTNSFIHLTLLNPSTFTGTLVPFTSNANVTYPYTNDLILQITCPQLISTYNNFLKLMGDGYAKIILDPMQFVNSSYPSVSNTNVLLVARDVEFSIWPTNLLLNSPPNLYTNTFWP